MISTEYYNDISILAGLVGRFFPGATANNISRIVRQVNMEAVYHQQLLDEPAFSCAGDAGWA